MDEVEVIQNHLLSNAGEDTDVILGLGYDNSLGSQIGITLIATGFEHKDPFEKKATVETTAVKKDDDKIVMTLEMPVKEIPVLKVVKPIQQPTLQFEEEEDKAIAEISETPAVQFVEDEMMPKLVETKSEKIKVEPPGKITGEKAVEKIDEAPVFFEISSAKDQTPVIAFDIPTTPVPSEKPVIKTSVQTIISTNKNASNAPSSGVKLAKPAQIYVEEQPEAKSNSKEELLPLQITIKADETGIEDMQMVVKSHQAAEEEQLVQQTQPIMMSNVEDLAPQDETEELRRRAIERIAKLRNLSFNINAADPNNEFEMVPAYLRRNMELHNSIAEVENFYSNYTVKSDDNNQAEISTINSFLEGKKPD